ncbi:rpa1 [Symbiodinium natans]|uniref:Rpa1 protein n=1 Tax=Symbiodinium natans TaxID=878477 RepID=A0A812U6X1_9DINO|nr:rpa1 [Symbiodinium natans]
MLLKHLIQVCSEGKEANTSLGINLDGKSKTPGDIWNGRLDGDKEEARGNHGVVKPSLFLVLMPFL